MSPNFHEEYERQVIKSMRELGEKLFPEEVMEQFRMAAEQDISEGKNVCPCGAVTMERIYPVGHHLNHGWICSKHAQSMWAAGLIGNGRGVVFNMEKENRTDAPGA